jgi:capsular polysaccharide export protein
MLYWAQEENPGARILIKTHPETAQGFRQGHFKAEDATGRISLFDAAVSPWALLEGAVAVYTVSSQMGFEAILAGHKPRLFGQPFYASWGLSQDEFPLTRRQRRLTRAQLAAGALFHYPVWYDPFRDELCSFETVLDVLEAKARAWREDHRGWSAAGMRLWKRRPLQRFFGQHKRMVFSETLPKDGRRAMIWAGKAQEGSAAVRVEDGFLRSRGLGAELVPPLSLVADTSGIYYDPGLPSDLEGWIAKRAALSPAQERRASALIRQVTGAGLSKYNLGGARPDLPVGRRILVPGQVEDDASIRKGAGKVRTNLGLLRAARDANPEAVILYKPHPDVEADLRPGAIPAAEAAALADLVLEKIDTAALLDMVDEVWTMTSLTGFEALLRGVRVVTLGAPFYAGWGLTTDLGAIPARRQARVPLEGLVHAALIDYPRYFDPLTGAPCPAEIAAKRLAEGSPPNRSPANRALSKLQGLLAGGTHWWR